MQPTKAWKHLNVLDVARYVIAAGKTGLLALVWWAAFTMEEMWKEKDLIMLLGLVLFMNYAGTMTLAMVGLPVVVWLVAGLTTFAMKMFLWTMTLTFMTSMLHGLRMTLRQRKLILLTMT